MQSETTGDQVTQAIAAMFGVGQAGIDFGAMLRAVVEHRQEAVERWKDRYSHLLDNPLAYLDASTDRAAAEARVAQAMEEARILGIESDQAEAVRLLCSGALAAGILRTGRDWQAVMDSLRPRILGALDEYLADPDPSPSARRAVVDEVAILFQEIADFLRDQSHAWEADLRALRRDLLVGQAPTHGTRLCRTIDKKPW